MEDNDKFAICMCCQEAFGVSDINSDNIGRDIRPRIYGRHIALSMS